MPELSFPWWFYYLAIGIVFTSCAAVDNFRKGKLSFDRYTIIVILVIWPMSFLHLFTKNDGPIIRMSLVFSLIVISGGEYAYREFGLTAEEKVARARQTLEQEKQQIKREHVLAVQRAIEEVQRARERREIQKREIRAEIELARIEAERRALRHQPIPEKLAHEMAQAQAQLQTLEKAPDDAKDLAHAQAQLKALERGPDYSKLSVLSGSKSSPKVPLDEQKKLILSGLWLGACFFLQRIFEKLFKDKGYALLTVCAVGFILAFFTANYFLLGGSVTGGLMGSVGDRGLD